MKRTKWKVYCSQTGRLPRGWRFSCQRRQNNYGERVEGGGEDAAVIGSECGLKVGGIGGRSLAKEEFERLRLANDENAAEVEALVDRAGEEARRLREEKEGLVEALQDAEQR